MRLQSPASTGLLPASYSRRRRNNRNGEGLSEGGASYREDESSASTYDNIPEVGSLGHRQRRGGSPSKPRLQTIPSSSGDGDIPEYDSENDENDGHRGNEMLNPYSTEDVMPKPPKLSDFLVDDSSYRRFLVEGGRGAKFRGLRARGNYLTDEPSWFLDPSFLSKLCAGLSFVAMLFLIFVAVIMEVQPLYIKGVSVKPAVADDGSYRLRKESSNAIKAATAYFVTMVLSLVYLQAKDANLDVNPQLGRICHLRRMVTATYFRHRRRNYSDIPESYHNVGRGSAGGVPGATLPTHHHQGEDRTAKGRKRPKKGGVTFGDIFEKISLWTGRGSSSGRKKDK